MSSDPSPAGRSRAPWIAAAFLALVVVAGIIVVIAVRGGSGSHHAAGRPSASPHASSAPATTSGACPSDTSHALPTSAPPAGIRWVTLPASTAVQVPDGGSQYGPCHATSTVATGYAHTPDGALVAAAQIFMRASASGTMARQTIAQQFVDSDWKTKLLAGVAATPSPSTDNPAIAAYAINSYTAATAQLSLALGYSTTATYLVFRVGVQWSGGDWRMQAPTGGDWSSAVTQMATLNGFVTWAPQ